MRVTGLDALTGLPEYRNGGLLLDTGVLRAARCRRGRARTWDVGDELVVEWRALTVALLDELAAAGARAARRAMPDRCRWPACSRAEPGRRAGARRSACAAGRPPLAVDSDGTVF